MASKRELLKRQAEMNVANRGAESVLTTKVEPATSSTVVEAPEAVIEPLTSSIPDKPIETTTANDTNIPSIENIPSTESIPNVESVPNKTNIPTEDSKPIEITAEVPLLQEETVEINNEIAPIAEAEVIVAEEKIEVKSPVDAKPVNTNNVGRPKKTPENLLKKYTGPDKNVGMRLASQEDIDFLNFYPLQLGLTKKEYFNQIMAKAIDDANRKAVNLNDELVKQFVKGGRAELTTKNVTIAVPEDMITEMKKAGAKHRMIIQRYIAYVVYKARMESDFE